MSHFVSKQSHRVVCRIIKWLVLILTSVLTMMPFFMGYLTMHFFNIVICVKI